jgi:tRNA pseudouridine55 synthase
LTKTYLLRVTLGVTTDTYDATGTPTQVIEAIPDTSRDDLLKALRTFVGEYRQRPPAYSAIKVGGKRAYALARSGEKVELASRTVHVTSIRLVQDLCFGDRRHLILRVHCSRGTYVRSLAHDLGQLLGCGAHLSYLLRERVGRWAMPQVFGPWQIEAKAPFTHLPAFQPIADILPFPKVLLRPESEERIRHGSPIGPKDIQKIEAATCPPEWGSFLQICSSTGNLLGIYRSGGSDERAGGQSLVPERILG